MIPLPNIPTPAQSRDRMAQLLETQARHIARMADKAAAYANRPRDQWARYEFLDALSFVEPSDEIAETMAMLRLEELRIDADGFALNEDGDTVHNSVRRYVPLQSLDGEPVRRIAA